MVDEEYYRWQSGLAWFGPTAGCALWIGIAAAVLAVRASVAEALIFATLFVLIQLCSIVLWRRRQQISLYRAWQVMLTCLWIASLAALAVLQWREVYPKVNLDAWGMVCMWVGVGVGVGVPLLLLDTKARHKSKGARGVFGALFDLIASFF